MMMTHFNQLARTAAACIVLVAVIPAAAFAQTAEARYNAARAREDKARDAIASAAADAPISARTPVITEARSIITAYEALVRAYRASGYADNALYNAAVLADALHDRFGLTTDRDAALRLFKRLVKEYPTAPLAKQAVPSIERLERIAAERAVTPIALSPDLPESARATAGEVKRAEADASATPAAKLTSINRVLLPGIVRVTIEVDREVPYHEETLKGPSRLFFDLQGVMAAPSLTDAVLRYHSDVVRQIRTGRHPNVTRVVLDFEGVTRHSVYTLYNPFRIVVDAESASSAAQTTPPPPPAPPLTIKDADVVPSVVPAVVPASTGTDEAAQVDAGLAPIASGAGNVPVAAVAATPRGVPSSDALSKEPAPKAPAVNGIGGFSIARQLGLGVSRIVIDPGHGGHDPGAQARGLNEADLTLDVALRLQTLLEKEPGLHVVLTRRNDVYVSLEERTAIANREGADLFLSIHANTSRNTSARGVETYFLSFAASPDAEAVAARENSAHAGEMHKLPDIVRAITLNNKLDESRDFATMVQEALVSRLRRSSKSVQNRGVKKAPFVVLIGAAMPSVLAEVSFMSNRQELQLLKTAAYKQRIAEALHAAVMRYRRSLKGSATADAQ